MDWQGKKVLVIGANGGIGKEFAKQLRERGCIVAGTYRRQSPNGMDEVYQLDLEKGLTELEDTIQEILKKSDPEIVIFSAGSAYYGSFTRMDTEDIAHIYQVDLIAPAIVSKTVISHLQNRGGGHLHIVSAIAGVMPAIKNMAAYSSAKFGLVGLARSLAMECIGTPVRVTVSCPAGVLTELPKNSHGDTESFIKVVGNLQKNFEEPSEVVKGILDLMDSREVVIFPTEKARLLYKK